MRSVGATALPEAKEGTVRPKERQETPYSLSLPPLAFGQRQASHPSGVRPRHSTAWAFFTFFFFLEEGNANGMKSKYKSCDKQCTVCKTY